MHLDKEGMEAVVGSLSEIPAYSTPSIMKADRPLHSGIYEDTSRMLLFLGSVVSLTLLWLMTLMRT